MPHSGNTQIRGLALACLLMPLQTMAKNSPPVANAGPDRVILINNAITLAGSAADPDGDSIVGWNWAVSNAPAGSNPKFIDTDTPNPQFRTDTAGSYTLSLIVSDGVDFSTPDTAELATPPTAVAAVTPDQPETDQTVSFETMVTGGFTPFTFSWNFGDGDTSTEQNPTHMYALAGTYPVSVVITDRIGQVTSDSLELIVTSSYPTVLATAVPESGVCPLSVNLSALASGGAPPYSFHWDLGDGSTSLLQNPSRVYITPGTNTAMVTVMDSAGQTNSATVTITVEPNELPMLHATAVPASGAAPLNVQFSANATSGDSPLSYSWNFGDGSSNAMQAPLHQYLLPGTYTASAVVADFDGDTDSTNIQIKVFAPFTITNCVPVAEGFVLEWIPAGGKNSVVQWTTNLTETPFTNIPSALSYPLNTYTDTVYGALDGCFYRVRGL